MSFWTRSIASVWRNVRNTLQLLPPGLRLGQCGARRGSHQDECNQIRGSALECIRLPHRLLGNNDGVSRLENHVPSERSFFNEIVVVEREVDEPAVYVPNHENIIQFCELLKTAGERERLGDADGPACRGKHLAWRLCRERKTARCWVVRCRRSPAPSPRSGRWPLRAACSAAPGVSSGHRNVPDEGHRDPAIVADQKRTAEIRFFPRQDLQNVACADQILRRGLLTWVGRLLSAGDQGRGSVQEGSDNQYLSQHDHDTTTQLL